MKANIHPEFKEVKVTCACGESFTTKSNKDISAEVCHKCHAAYGNGNNALKAKSSNIEKFKRKYGQESK